MALRPATQAVDALFGDQSARDARASVRQVADRNPDTEAKIQRQARTVGVPYDSARAYQPDIARSMKMLEVDWDNFARQAPKTAKFLSSTSNAAIAHDDIGALGAIEQFFTGLRERAATMGAAKGRQVKSPEYWRGSKVPSQSGIVSAVGSGTVNLLAGLAGIVESSQELAEPIDVTAGLQRRFFGGTIEDVVGGGARSVRQLLQSKSSDMRQQRSNGASPFLQDIYSGVESVPFGAGGLGRRQSWGARPEKRRILVLSHPRGRGVSTNVDA